MGSSLTYREEELIVTQRKLLAASVVTICTALASWPYSASAVLIDFNDQASIAAAGFSTDVAARFTFADKYSQSGMTFAPTVIPPDPRLINVPMYSYYHLAYENQAVYDRFVNPSFTPELAAIEPRFLASHAEDQFVQFTYDPTNSGTRQKFDLVSMDVTQGPVNVGVEYTSGDIGVFNNLQPGFRWLFVSGNTGLVRATIEGIGFFWSVDNIAFDPDPPTDDVMIPTKAISQALVSLPALFTEELHALVTNLGPEQNVPEPSTLGLLGISLLLALLIRGRRHCGLGNRNGRASPFETT